MVISRESEVGRGKTGVGDSRYKLVGRKQATRIDLRHREHSQYSIVMIMEHDLKKL